MLRKMYYRARDSIHRISWPLGDDRHNYLPSSAFHPQERAERFISPHWPTSAHWGYWNAVCNEKAKFIWQWLGLLVGLLVGWLFGCLWKNYDSFIIFHIYGKLYVFFHIIISYIWIIKLWSIYRQKKCPAISAPRKMGTGYLVCNKKYLWLLF